MLKHNINLLAYHLPLDVHPVYGNNAQLGQHLGFRVSEVVDDGLFYIGELSRPYTATELQQQVAKVLKPPATIGAS